MRILLALVCLLGASLGLAVLADTAPKADDVPRTIRVITVDGTIDPATSGYIRRAIEVANNNKDELLLIELNTPGGLVDATQDIIIAMLASKTPIAVYVTPEGGRALSAGTFILVSAQIAAMSPTTTTGAATPIGGQGGEDLERKVVNAMEAYMRSLAEKRDRNAEWATKAVTEGISATERESLELKVIDLIATDRNDLLKKIDGKTVMVAGEQKVTLNTAGAPVEELPMRPQERLMHFLANPNVIGILILIAIYGIIGEISNPGAIFPGVVGGIALILVFYAANLLPLNYTALALIVFAVALFIIESQTATTGILATGGAVALGLGLFLIVDVNDPVFRTSLSVVIPATLFTMAFFVFAIGAVIKAKKRHVTTGSQGLTGREVPARTDLDPYGKVFTDGSWWTVESIGGPVKAGEMVRIVEVQGLKLVVEPVIRTEEVI